MHKKRIDPDTWYADRAFQKDFYDAMENVQSKYESTLVEQREKRFGLMICIPTGGGKTRLMVVYAINEFLYAQKKRRVLWLAQSNELLDQARDTFSGILKDEELGDDSDSPEWAGSFFPASYYGGKDNWISINSETTIVFANFNTLNHRENYSMENIKQWMEPDSVIIVDEAHHAPASTYQDVIKELTDNRTRLLFGLSATPLRTQMDKNDDLNNLFPTELIDKDNKYVHVSMDDLVKSGHLVPRISEEVIHTLSEEELLEYASNPNPNRYQALGDVLGGSDEFNHRVADRYLQNRKKYGKTVIFTASITQAKKLREAIQKKITENRDSYSDVQVFLVTGENKGDLAIFKNSENSNTGQKKWETNAPKVMVNIKVLGEGVDIQDIHTVFLAKPSKSPIDITQMVGRALRSVPAENEKNEAYVVNFAVKGLENKLVIQDPRFTMDLYELECGLRSDVLANRDKGKQKQAMNNLIKEEAAQNIKLPFVSFAMVGYYEIWPDGIDEPSIIQIVTMDEYKKIEAYLDGKGKYPRRRLHFHGGRTYKEQKELFDNAKKQNAFRFNCFYNKLEPIEQLKNRIKNVLKKNAEELRIWSDELYGKIEDGEDEESIVLKVFVKDRKIGSAEDFWESIRSEIFSLKLETFFMK